MGKRRRRRGGGGKEGGGAGKPGPTPTAGVGETRTLRPGDKGTKKLIEKFGDQLLCVRYRYDHLEQVRYKTVELVIERRGGADR